MRQGFARKREDALADAEPISVMFPSLDAARSARKRLARAGFARNSIDIGRRRDAFEVMISVREENRDRAERILTGNATAADLGEAASRAGDFLADNRWMALTFAGLAGFLLYRFTSRH